MLSSKDVNTFDEFIKNSVRQENIIFENALRENAVPKIEGDITKGKIKWRGIKIVQQNELLKTTRWLEQRGKQISPKIIINGSVSGFS